MADAPAPAARSGGKKFLGQPWWIWAAGGLALLGGYVYLRRKAAASAAQPAAAGTTTGTYTSPTGLSWDQFLLFIHDQQGSTSSTTAPTAAGSPAPAPAPAPRPAPGPPRPAAKTPRAPLLSGTYRVRPGDTLASLARRFGISRVELAHGNGLGTGAGLHTGQVLHVPGPLRTRAAGGPG